MAKRRKKSNTKKESKFLFYFAWFLAVVAMVLSALVAGYYYGYEEAKEEIVKKEKTLKENQLALLKQQEKTTSKKAMQDVNNRLKEVLKNNTEHYSSASHEYDEMPQISPPKRAVKKVVTKPKLAIIIDDVSIKSHVNALKSLNIPLTMSFLPPSAARPNSAKLASKEKFYMVHLPMEAQSFSAEEPLTLRVNDSEETISDRIKELKRLFPKVAYINNHTGSKFTSNELAMNRLIFALNAQNINFIDSRTTAQTKAPKVLKNYGISYVARDVFLDHHMDIPYIKKQIKKAISIAKSHGTAIAIGHPHANTILALSESKKLFKDVELVYVNKLY